MITTTEIDETGTHEQICICSQGKLYNILYRKIYEYFNRDKPCSGVLFRRGNDDKSNKIIKYNIRLDRDGYFLPRGCSTSKQELGEEQAPEDEI